MKANKQKRPVRAPKLRRIKKGAPLIEHDPFEYLTDTACVEQTIEECLQDNNFKEAMKVLAMHVDALNTMHLVLKRIRAEARRVGLKKSDLEQAIKEARKSHRVRDINRS